MTAMIQLVKENQLLEVRIPARPFYFLSRLLDRPFPLVAEKDDDINTQYYRGERRLCGTACSVGGASADG